MAIMGVEYLTLYFRFFLVIERVSVCVFIH